MTTESVSATKVVAIKDDAVSALINLGFNRTDATEAVDRATRELDGSAPLDAVIKAALAKAKGGKPAMPANGPAAPPPIHSSNGQRAPLPAPSLGKQIDSRPLPPKPPGSDKPKAVGKMETIEVHVADLQAALLCTAKDETRYYLQGVYIHRTAEGFVRAVATDGTRCLIANLYRENKDKPGPKWLDKGVIIPADGLASRLKLIDKEHHDQLLGVKIAYGENQPRVEISDGFGVNVFRVKPIEGTFPNYESVTTARWSGVGTEREDWKPTGFNPKYLKAVADIAKVLESNDVQFFDYAGPDGQVQPVLVTFGAEADGIALFLMPLSKTADKLGTGTRMLLAPAIKLTLAALKAHQTRNEDAAKKATGAEKQAALDKAKDFAKRITEVLANAGSGTVQPALPAPKPPKPVKAKKPAAKAAAPKKVIGNGGKKPPASKPAAKPGPTKH